MELVVQYEYSAVEPHEASVFTGEQVKLIDRDGQGWILIEKETKQRGMIPEDWVVTNEGVSLTDLVSSQPAVIEKALSASSESAKKAAAARAAARKRGATLKRKLASKQDELAKKVKALEDLDRFLLEHQSASESARMAMVEEDDDDDDDVDADDVDSVHSKTNPGQQRANVVAEIFESEKSYGEDLKLIVEQFLEPLSQKSEIFNPRVLEILFSNILEILTKQSTFLEALDSSIGLKPTFKSEIGKVFEEHSESFKLYAVYCANHTRATEHLEGLSQNEEAKKILEACRLLCAARSEAGHQHQSGIGLGGYLLTPIQRICKYPLLLRELLKATPQDHPDHDAVESALSKMTVVAQAINEDKRNTEHLMIIEERITQWKGPSLVETSSVLIGEGVLQKISNGKAQERVFYLFDNLLVYCKRTSGGRLMFRGRIPTDCLSVKDVRDGKFEGRSFANGMKFENPAKDTSYVVYGKTPAEKQEWLDLFKMERAKVSADSAAGIDRRSRERINTAAAGTISRSRGNQFRSAKKKKSVDLTDGVNATAAEMKQSQSSDRVAKFKPVNVSLSISRDCQSWAGKNALLFPRSKAAVIQEILDKFMCSHLVAEDFELVQHTPVAEVVLPDEPIPLFAMDKSVETPYELYLYHKKQGKNPIFVYPEEDDI